MNTFQNVLAIASPFLVLGLAGLGWLYRNERERRRAVEHQVSELKYKSYVGLLGIFFDMMKAKRRGEELPEGDVIDRMADVNKDLTLYGSDQVLKLYLDWQRKSREGIVDLEHFGALILAIRRDMGNPKTAITTDDVLRQIITDYDAAKARGDLQKVAHSDVGDQNVTNPARPPAGPNRRQRRSRR